MDLKYINCFDEEYERLSNFYQVEIHFNNFTFPTVEHAYVSGKSLNPMFWHKISKLPYYQAGKAKRLGQKIKLRKDWDMMKLILMRKFLKEKFHYEEFSEFLFSTGDAQLIEGNHWHDNYWGDCYCQRCRHIKGQNQLGKLIMTIRGKL